MAPLNVNKKWSNNNSIIWGGPKLKGAIIFENSSEKHSSQEQNMKKTFWEGCTKIKGAKIKEVQNLRELGIHFFKEFSLKKCFHN